MDAERNVITLKYIFESCSVELLWENIKYLHVLDIGMAQVILFAPHGRHLGDLSEGKMALHPLTFLLSGNDPIRDVMLTEAVTWLSQCQWSKARYYE